MTETMTCVDCEKSPTMSDPIHCCDRCGCYSCAECHTIDADTFEVFCCFCLQHCAEKMEDDDFACKCLSCEKVFATGEMSGGWTQRERTFCSKECEDKMPDWKTEPDEDEEEDEDQK